MARKSGKTQKENPVWCTGDSKRWKGNIGEESREGKTGTVFELSLEEIFCIINNNIIIIDNIIIIIVINNNKNNKGYVAIFKSCQNLSDDWLFFMLNVVNWLFFLVIAPILWWWGVGGYLESNQFVGIEFLSRCFLVNCNWQGQFSLFPCQLHIVETKLV